MKVGMTLGTNYAGVPEPDTFFSYIERVEELGFDSLWVGDHIAWTNPTFEALTAVGMYAARTKRVTIGTSILILPLRHPVYVAKIMGTIACISGGRLIAGLGVGGENPKEFQACGVDHHHRGQIMDESCQIMRRLWTEDHVSFEGRHFKFQDVSLDPKPPHIPMFLGGRSEPAYKRAAKFGDGWIDVFSSPRHFGEGKAAIERFGAKPGFQWVQYEYMHVSSSREESKQRATDYLNRTYNMDTGDRVNAFASFGTGADIAERLQKYADLGANHVIINPTCPPAEKHEQLEAIAAEVLPLIRRM